MLRKRQSSLPKLEVWRMLIWRHLLANFFACSMPGGDENSMNLFPYIDNGKIWDYSAALHTIPARVRFGFLKCSRFGSKGNSFENVHGAEKTKGNILSLDASSFCLYNAKLVIKSSKSFHLQ